MRAAGFEAMLRIINHAAESPERLRKGLARHPVPVILLARLAVDHTWQRRGLGAALLLDALRRILAAADIVGVRAVMVHAKDEGVWLLSCLLALWLYAPTQNSTETGS